MTYHHHIKRMLWLPINLVQLIAVTCWLGSLALNPYTSSPLSAEEMLTALSISLVWLGMSSTKSFALWRIGGGVYMILAAYLFKLQIERMDEAHMHTWAMAVSTLITLCGVVFFVRALDYVCGSTAVWLVMWDANPPLLNLEALPLYAVFVLSALMLGAMTNVSFIHMMRKTYELKESYRHLAETDMLTGVPNRRALMNSLEQALHATDSQRLFFAMLDIDDFKLINDRHGHDVGDAVLVEFARHLEQTRDLHAYGRLGGEEFGLLLASDSLAAASQAIEALLQRLAAQPTQGITLSFSAGLVAVAGQQNVTRLLKSADECLYRAKRAGKHRVVAA
ncbi:diguanylate cyclase (GGDEF) domain-containing protein [Pseudomonas flavescens]|uniref:diguanylate cyclase n=1 Tax=Phytopseudomonas flavescens TaxID=29435 RepID=A0A1G8PWT7_9GAMM|nr:GGDEF domain-containing protein [Pseudomonas flavescens]SDI96917.1 diguanylate cyclase (GGDEF) domain-containing protein [Pseudomonas flavescens]